MRLVMRQVSIKIPGSIALLLACASALSASDTTFVHQGARVRVTFEERTQVADPSGAIWYRSEPVRLVGKVTMLESDTLVFLREGAETPLSIPNSKIEGIEVSQGTSRHVGKGAWIGALGGAVAGFLWGVAVGPVEGWMGCSKVGCGAGGAVILGAGGAIVGAGVGALIKTERWQQAAFPIPPPVALNVGKDGSVRLAFSLRL